MKKILKINTVFLILLLVMTKYVMAVSCNLEIKSSKTEIEANNEFTVEIYLSNLESEGVIAFGGTLEYDKEKLTLVKMEGKNGWETPTDGQSYNSSNGMIAIDRDSIIETGDETIIELTFKANENMTGIAKIELKDVMVADGKTTPYSIDKISKEVTITEKSNSEISNNSDNSNNTDNNNNNNNNDNNSNNSDEKNEDDDSYTGKFPFTGFFKENPKRVVLIPIIIVAIIVVISFIRLKLVDRKIKKNNSIHQ